MASRMKKAASEQAGREAELAPSACGLTAWKVYVYIPGTFQCQVRAKRTSKRREARLRLLHVPIGEIENAVDQIFSRHEALDAALADVKRCINDGHHIRC